MPGRRCIGARRRRRPIHSVYDVASLKVTSDSGAVKVQRLLEKAEHLCLVSNSLRGQRHLITEIVTTD